MPRHPICSKGEQHMLELRQSLQEKKLLAEIQTLQLGPVLYL